MVLDKARDQPSEFWIVGVIAAGSQAKSPERQSDEASV
jgi:hypothetical protein